jgi:hypothetical protein
MCDVSCRNGLRAAAPELVAAGMLLHAETGKAARVFTEFEYKTKKSWACERRVVAKAEYLDKGENPRFVVTSLGANEWAARELYEQFYCQRGEMENRIKEQMCLFAYRLSTEEMKGNQLRMYLSALAYTLVEALRRLALKGTEWAEAQVDTIRLRLFNIGTLVHISARRVWLEPCGWNSVPAIRGNPLTAEKRRVPRSLNASHKSSAFQGSIPARPSNHAAAKGSRHQDCSGTAPPCQFSDYARHLPTSNVGREARRCRAGLSGAVRNVRLSAPSEAA